MVVCLGLHCIVLYWRVVLCLCGILYCVVSQLRLWSDIILSCCVTVSHCLVHVMYWLVRCRLESYCYCIVLRRSSCIGLSCIGYVLSWFGIVLVPCCTCIALLLDCLVLYWIVLYCRVLSSVCLVVFCVVLYCLVVYSLVVFCLVLYGSGVISFRIVVLLPWIVLYRIALGCVAFCFVVYCIDVCFIGIVFALCCNVRVCSCIGLSLCWIVLYCRVSAFYSSVLS